MIAVTGSAGLLGGHIVDTLSEQGLPVMGLYREGHNKYLPKEIVQREADILDYPSLIMAFEGVKTVIHVAAMVSFNTFRKEDIYQTNVVGTRNVVNACLQMGVKKLIHVSSVASLSEDKNNIITEDSNNTDYITSDYGYSKYLSELEIYRGAEEGMTVNIVHPSVILSGARIRRTSASLINYVWKENSYYPCGSLNYVDARDVADVILKLCQNHYPNENFILSSGNVSFKDFYFKVAQRLKKKPPSREIPKKWGYWVGMADEILSVIFRREPQITRKSMQLASQEFQYRNSKVQITLDFQFRNLEHTLDWVCNNYYKNIRAKMK